MSSGESPASAIASRMAATIGAPSGLERVRWKPSPFSPQPSTKARIRAPRARAASAFSSTSAAAPSPMTKPSRFLEKGFAAPSGGSFCVDRADRSEKRISDSGFTDPSVPIESTASASPRRMASTPSWIAVAPDEHAVESETGDPIVPNRSAIRSAAVPKLKRSCQSRNRPVAAAARRSA